MNDKKNKNPQIENKEPSYGKIMTDMLIPKGSYSNPRRILSGIAFISLVAFFLFAALNRSCQRDELQQQEEKTSHYSIQSVTRLS